jgi:hypothetical protein
MLHSEIIAVCSQIRTKHISTLCGLKVQFFIVTRGGTCSNQCAFSSTSFSCSACHCSRQLDWCNPWWTGGTVAVLFGFPIPINTPPSLHTHLSEIARCYVITVVIKPWFSEPLCTASEFHGRHKHQSFILQSVNMTLIVFNCSILFY